MVKQKQKNSKKLTRKIMEYCYLPEIYYLSRYKGRMKR